MKEIYVSNYAKDIMTEVNRFLSSNGVFINIDDKRYTDLFDNVKSIITGYTNELIGTSTVINFNSIGNSNIRHNFKAMSEEDEDHYIPHSSTFFIHD